MSFRLVPKLVTVNGVMAVILRCFSEIGRIWCAQRKNGCRYTQTFCNRNV